MGRRYYSRGTVHCRYCHNAGHNVKTCEVLANWVKEDPYERAYYVEQRYKVRFDERNGNRLPPKEQKKCSYCGEHGHDKRKCDSRLEDLVHSLKENKHYRKNFIAWANDKGFGVGALVSLYRSMYLVTDVMLDEISCELSADKTLMLSNVETGRTTHVGIDSYLIVYNSVKVLSAGEPIVPSNEWLEGRDQRYEDFTTSRKIRSIFRDLDGWIGAP